MKIWIYICIYMALAFALLDRLVALVREAEAGHAWRAIGSFVNVIGWMAAIVIFAAVYRLRDRFEE
jgi:hypothetical protein